ncbi:hypothetical protein N9772_03520 [Bacteroidia bacterium]|nr:hypothetical protein [Bacteroidia bacterium]
MKKIVTVLMTFLLIAGINLTEAQTLSKNERKALKKEIKTYKKNPEKWVRMQKKHKTEVVNLNDEVIDLKAKLAEMDKLRAEREELATELAILKAKYASLESEMPSTKLPMGTVYQVQMGYYEYLDLASFNEKLKTIKAEDVDGKKRYVIGHFVNLMEAVQFRNDIKILGIDDAFVSQYKNGTRIMDFDAMKAIGN